MSSSDFTFPSPVGGVPFPSDFAPSILFAVLYGLLVPVVIWRFWLDRSRTIAVFGTITFSIERVVIFGLRAQQSHNAQRRDSHGLTIYMQTTFAIGYVSLASDLVMLMRSLLAAATYPKRLSPRVNDIHLEAVESPQASHSLISAAAGENSSSQAIAPPQPENQIDDRAKERARYRLIGGSILPLCWASIILGTIYGILYPKAKDSSDKAQLVQQLRYASSGINCLIVTLLQGYSIYSAFTVRNIHRNHTYLITALATLMNVITIYRLVAMKNETTAIDSLAPGSLNEPGSKAVFYVLHVAPEWITAAILLGINVRERFETGFWGEHWPAKNKRESTAKA